MEKFTRQVSADIVDDHQGTRQEEPNDAIKDVWYKKGGRHEDEEENQMDPCILPELHQKVPSLQSQHKCYQTWTNWEKKMIYPPRFIQTGDLGSIVRDSASRF